VAVEARRCLIVPVHTRGAIWRTALAHAPLTTHSSNDATSLSLVDAVRLKRRARVLFTDDIKDANPKP
jgi:hypothetical protein